MIDWINNYFGIENDISVPIFISLIVFITGGLVQFLLSQIKLYLKRRRNRKIFNLLLEELILSLKTRERKAFKFYPTLESKTKGSWQFRYIPIDYLDTLLESNYDEIYYSFRKKFKWNRFFTKKKEKAFHRIWSKLRYIKFFENKLEKDLEQLPERFQVPYSNYKEKIKAFQNYHIEFGKSLNKELPFIKNPDVHKYVEYYNTIWRRWNQIEVNTRIHYHVTYNKLIIPLIELNKNNSSIEFTIEMNKYLMECAEEFQNIQTVLKVYRTIFKDHYYNYRSGQILLQKYNSVVKNCA